MVELVEDLSLEPSDVDPLKSSAAKAARGFLGAWLRILFNKINKQQSGEPGFKSPSRQECVEVFHFDESVNTVSSHLKSDLRLFEVNTFIITPLCSSILVFYILVGWFDPYAPQTEKRQEFRIRREQKTQNNTLLGQLHKSQENRSLNTKCPFFRNKLFFSFLVQTQTNISPIDSNYRELWHCLPLLDALILFTKLQRKTLTPLIQR